MQDTQNQAHKLMRSIIQRVATGPELSKDLSLTETTQGVSAILNGEIDPVQAAIFFIALRMKRETHDEFKGVLDGIREHNQGITAEVDEVVDIADPFNGYNRTLPAAPFLPPLLAACGLNIITHGLDAVAPKYGITHRHVLQAAGVNVDLSTIAASQRLSKADIGWSYIDQANYCPALHDLIPLRTQMVKRTVLTTIEVLAKPITGRNKTHFVSGYVHKPYPPVYAMLARHAGFNSALLLRGVEGGVIPSLRQEGKYFSYHDFAEEIGVDINPQKIGITQTVRGVPLPDEIDIDVSTKDAAKAAANAGMAALNGEKGATYDSLLYAGSLILQHVKKLPQLTDAAEEVRAVLDSATAVSRVI